MQGSIRSSERSLSSLLDLKLMSTKNQLVLEEGRRKTRKFCPIKMRIDDNQIYQHFVNLEKKKTSTDKALILKSLKSHFTLSTLIEDKQVQDTLLQKFKMCKINEGDYLMKQNDNASSFFILHQGKLIVEINGEPKRTIMPGQGFGQLALLYSAPRSASIKAGKHSHLWYIDRATFRNAVSTIIEKKFTQNRNFIEKNSFFTYLTQVQKDKLASIAINQKFQKGSKICKQGQLASSIYILKSGKLRKTCQGVKIGEISEGDSFEQYASLKKGSLRRQTITVLQDSQVLALGVQDIETVLGRSLPLIILRNNAKCALKNSKNFCKLSQQYLQKVIDCFQLKKVKQGQVIVNPSTTFKDMIFFVAQGAYEVSKDSNRSELYGDQAVTHPTSTYSFSILMKQDGKVAWTTLDKILTALGCSVQQAIEKNVQAQNAMSSQKNQLMQIKQQASKFDLSEFEVLKQLGEGQFGTVYLVTTKQKNGYYALKCISKHQTLKCKLQNHLKNEKEVLQTIQSPFIMEYIRSFKDSSYIYFLTQFINGMELFDVIRIIGLLTPSQSRFYGAILLHVLQTMHSNSIMYRDLKPENVMVCENGYLKLIDMGTCKKINNKTAARKTFTIIGTPNYMAPEILSGKGYNYSVDLWSLGVVLYQFMAGYVPFGQDAQDPYEIYQQILKNPLSFPKHMKDPNSNSFISQLLSKNADSRLGGSFSDLKKHSFFNNFDWHQLINKKMKPCFELPKEKILNCEKLKNNTKPLKSVLKPSKNTVVRKDLKQNWDECF